MFTKGSVLNLAKADAVVKDVIGQYIFPLFVSFAVFFRRIALDHIHSILTLFTASCEKEDDERELKRELLKLLRRRGN